MSDTLVVATKLHIPTLREGVIPRRRLVGSLIDGADLKLTLLNAPAGAGKTTLLSEWHSSPDETRAFAWVSLDRGDNEPARFWQCVIEALRTIEPGIGTEAEAALRARGVSLVDMVLPLLINELLALPQPCVLVLDDYHVVSKEKIHRSVEFLLAHQPETLHLAIATRSDPPLPLALLRGRNEITEVRAAELRFSQVEAAALLNDVLGLDLRAGDIARLQRRTEGWAAGLYLAALSLRGRRDVSTFIQSFAGDDRQIVDYLTSEVLEGQPEDLRAFLLRTSILERLCAPLCDAVTGEDDSARMLDRIERSNLFLIPLDTKRQWYRYHHLFAELLRHELRRAEPDGMPELHRRAAAWHREEGSVPEAIEHAAAAGDLHNAAELIAEHWNDFFNQGRLGTVAGWLDAVGERAVRADPRLCAAAAWLAMDVGRPDDAAGWIARAEQGIRDRRKTADSAVELEVAVLRAVHSFKVGDIARAREAALRLVELEPAGETFPRTVAHLMLGITSHWRGDSDEAIAPFEAAERMARATANDLAASYALGYLSVIRADRGELEEAERLGSEATGLSDDPGFVEHFVTMMGHLGQGKAGERRGDLDHAAAELARAGELSQRGAGAIEIACALLELARVRHLQGDLREARELLARARVALDACPDPGVLAGAVGKAERSLGRAATPSRGREGVWAEELTDRELAVLRLLASELSQREIGAALYVSLNTIKTHTKGIYRKLDASTRAEAVARAHELGLI